MTAASESLDIFGCPLKGMALIEASAGTGKTWHICALYLRLLLEAKRAVPEILVVTFTTAATAELKARIRSRMTDALLFLDAADAAAQQALIDADPFLGMLEAWMAKTGEEPGVLRAVLHDALARFDEAAIFTIHGFCQRVLASKAFSAGQAFSGTVEPDDVAIVTDVANDFWRRHIASGEASRALLMYVTAKRVTPETFRDFLLRELKKPLAQKRWPPGVDAALPDDFPALAAAFEAMRQCWQADREMIVSTVVKAVVDGNLSRTFYKAETVGRVFAEYDLLFYRREALAFDGSAQRLADLTLARLAKGTKKGRAAPCHAFFELAEAWMGHREDAMVELDRAYWRLLFLLQGEVAEVRRRKQEQRVISYDDMLFNLHAALADGAFAGLAAAIRAAYPAALIDEFQDTDPVQFSIFSAIYADSGLPVFLVGDPKQAIYGFRNADLQTYLRARHTVDRRFSLTQNQRSTPRLIAACNALFLRNRRAFMLEGLDYEPVSAGERERPVLVDETLSAGEAADGMVLWRLPGYEDGAYRMRGEALMASANACADEIFRLLKAAEAGSVRIGERYLAASDVAVLVRSHREGGMIQRALASRGIGSVSLAQESVWQSADARELALVLSAVLLPRHSARLKAALATELLGFDAAAIAAFGEDDGQELAWLERFMGYLAAWQSRGIGFALRRLLSELDVYARMLARTDGERRLTNLTHMAELLDAASQTHASPQALMRWLDLQLHTGKTGEDAQLRLESDEQLVPVLTIHRAKGLEFPFVFCPFLWDAFASGRSDALPGVSYHDGETLVIDFRELDEGEAERIKRQVRMERAAEDLRLLYVALTRAVFRCYVVTGCYTRQTRGAPSQRESARGLLNWLAAGGEASPESWLDGDAADRFAAIEAAWEALAARGEGVTLKALPDTAGMDAAAFLADAGILPSSLGAARMPDAISGGWRIGSFSSLIEHAEQEASGGDYDERAQETPQPAPESLPAADDILLFPARRYAGNCLHAVFEQADFTDETTWDAAILSALLQHPPYGRVRPEGGLGIEALKPMVRRMLADVLGTRLHDGVRLADVGMQRRLTELEFFLPARNLADGALFDLLSLHYPVPRLAFQRLNGYLKGFIDLVFEHDGRFYVADWKSNRLGMRQADFGEAAVDAAMAKHGYHLQHVIYTLALNRFLAQRLPDYAYERHFGGVFYLFVRGVRPDWKTANGDPCGVFFHRADAALIRELDALVGEGGVA